MSAARLVRVTAWSLLVLALAPVPALAQAPTPGPPGPFVFDIRGTTLGIPQTSDFYPAVPSDTVVPARGFGLQAGAHIYPFTVGPGRIGFGLDASFTRGTATSTTTSVTDENGVTTTVVLPDVAVTMRVVSPQLSVNFGSSQGWSYLTVGGGSATVRTEAGSSSASKTTGDVNAGAGARWFFTSHLGVGFDLRAHWIGGSTLFAASAGFSLK